MAVKWTDGAFLQVKVFFNECYLFLFPKGVINVKNSGKTSITFYNFFFQQMALILLQLYQLMSWSTTRLINFLPEKFHLI